MKVSNIQVLRVRVMCFVCEQHAWPLDLEHQIIFIAYLKHLRSVLCHLEEHFFYSAPNKVSYQKLHKFFEFMEGIPSNLFTMTEDCENSLVIFDDLMSQCSNDQHMHTHYSWLASPRGISFSFLNQNFFPPYVRTISLNSHYMIIFRNPDDWKHETFFFFCSKSTP